MTSTAATDTVPAARTTRTDSGTANTVAKTERSRTSSDEDNSGNARYFLAKANGDGDNPAFDREVASEGEALVEALRARSDLLRGSGVSRSAGLCGKEAAT